MFDFLFGKRKVNKSELFNKLYKAAKELYNKAAIDAERRSELSYLIEKNGYLPCSQAEALENLTPEEVIFCLEKKLELNGAFKDGRLIIENNDTSAVKKAGFKNADWIKREQHEIKLISLAGLGNGAIDSAPAKFIDWLRQIAILPSGCIEKGIMPCTIYLVPFSPRDFGNAYITAGAEEVSSKLEDKELKNIGIDGKSQVKLFAALAQLAGHPVIYDVIPLCGRFSKTVMLHPEAARWIDVNFMIDEISKALNFAALKLQQEFDEDDVTIVKNIYKSTLKSGSCDLTAEFMPIYNRFTNELEEERKKLSDYMTELKQQKKLQKRVKNIVSRIEGVKFNKIKSENDIKKRGEIINALINEGLWTLPDGAWRSSGLPVFEKMSEGGAYPLFRHYNFKGEDVTEYADADCETPYYFVYLENGKFNMPVINFYLEYLKTLQEDYNFDGFRISHTDFVTDEMSEKDLRPISCRAPVFLLRKINETMKKRVPHFASIAEYRLWNSYLKEYHKNMKFDVLWGNDAKTDCEKNPSEVISDNRELQNYNSSCFGDSLLSILKTYNNQDGEFRTVNRCIGLLDKDEALFRWFKFKFLPSGLLAQRPVLYADGDESFSKDGFENAVEEEVSLIRADDRDFYNRFNAVRRLALSLEPACTGEAQIIHQNREGFACWMISKETVKECLIIAANYLPRSEKRLYKNKDGAPEYTVKIHEALQNRKIDIPGDYELASEYIYEDDKKEFIEHFTKSGIKTIEIDKLEPCSFRIFKIKITA